MKLSTNCLSFHESSSLIKYCDETNGSESHSNLMSKLIKGHHFNSKIILHLPDTPSIPRPVEDLIRKEGYFYHIKNISLAEFCKIEFIQCFVKCGKVYSISVDTLLDLDNCAAFLPSGLLMISLNQSDYHSLGLNGKLDTNILRKNNKKYIVEVNPLQPGFVPGKNLYKRVLQTLSAEFLHFDIHIAWEPYNDATCPSSIAKYFDTLGYDITEKRCTIKQTKLSNIRLPIIEKLEDCCDVEDTIEWIGLSALGIDSNLLENNLLDLEQFTSDNSLTVAHCEGFFTPSTMLKVVNSLREWCVCRFEEAVPYTILTCYGPPDALITWNKKQNHFRTAGDNFYTLVLRRDSTGVISTEVCQKPLRFYRKTSNNI